ncbi:hypothetical protein [Paenibacillus lupini]|uniref:hypothetical protein n=1 Tax=Paenibacillus lupini TaxID=1450204 RepID=UPI00141DBCEE|nr:hypothetical protein [Paenibacillus lupini]NIK22886.1 hypothetical protein [Paenibacillus lupini]
MGNDSVVVEDNYDGGYYAIKGFLYQFDSTLLTILKNPNIDVKFEQVQDISYEDYVIQVKHKESQTYSDSKIRKPVLQLMNLFQKDTEKKYALYCYFKDKPILEKNLKLSELDSILGAEKKNYKRPLKIKFIQNFVIKFSHDYSGQFLETIELIKKTYSCKDNETAVYYHSIFRSKLLEMAIQNRDERQLNSGLLSSLLSNVKSVVFHAAYADYLSKEKYEGIVKKMFFTLKKMNIDNYERLFIIPVDDMSNEIVLLTIIGRIFQKFHRPDKSPPPYVVFKNIKLEKLNLIKRTLIDREIIFNDGTYFNGDKFRLNKLTSHDKSVMVKIVENKELEEIMSAVSFQEVYQFYFDSLTMINEENLKKSRHYQIQIDEVEQITKMIT